MALPKTLFDLMDRANVQGTEREELATKFERIFAKIHRHGFDEGYARGAEETMLFMETCELEDEAANEAATG